LADPSEANLARHDRTVVGVTPTLAAIWENIQWTGEPSNCALEEHDALAWLTDKELHGLRLADPRLSRLLHGALEGMI
jgi:hypothetical protein